MVGASVSAFEISYGVNTDTPGIFVKQVETSLDGISYDVVEIDIDVFQVARTDADKISTVIV